MRCESRAGAYRPRIETRAELNGHGDVADLLARFGRNPFSFFLRYDAPWHVLRGETTEGTALYLEHRGVALLWGDPLSDAADATAFLDELTTRLRRRRLRVCLLVIGAELAGHALARGYSVLKIGEQPTFALPSWRPPSGDSGKRLRWCLNKARRAGVEVRAYEEADEPAVAEALAAWKDGLGRAAADSFLRASPLALADEKRLFLARSNGRIDALLACAPVPAAGGWLLEDLIRRPDAPMGATETVVVHALEALAGDGAERAWLDLAPLRGAHDQLDARARLLFRAASPAVSLFDTRYRFRALTTYLDKFQPTSWTPRYVALNPPWPSVSLLRALRTLL